MNGISNTTAATAINNNCLILVEWPVRAPAIIYVRGVYRYRSTIQDGSITNGY
jgi:hypothetical protein